MTLAHYIGTIVLDNSVLFFTALAIVSVVAFVYMNKQRATVPVKKLDEKTMPAARMVAGVCALFVLILVAATQFIRLDETWPITVGLFALALLVLGFIAFKLLSIAKNDLDDVSSSTS